MIKESIQEGDGDFVATFVVNTTQPWFTGSRLALVKLKGSKKFSDPLWMEIAQIADDT